MPEGSFPCYSGGVRREIDSIRAHPKATRPHISAVRTPPEFSSDSRLLRMSQDRTVVVTGQIGGVTDGEAAIASTISAACGDFEVSQLGWRCASRTCGGRKHGPCCLRVQAQRRLQSLEIPAKQAISGPSPETCKGNSAGVSYRPFAAWKAQPEPFGATWWL